MLTQTEQSRSPRLESVGSSAGHGPVGQQQPRPASRGITDPAVRVWATSAWQHLICTREHRQRLIFRTGRWALKVKQLKSEHSHQLLRQNTVGHGWVPTSVSARQAPPPSSLAAGSAVVGGSQGRRRDCQVEKGDRACREVCEPPCTEWLPQTEKRRRKRQRRPGAYFVLPCLTLFSSFDTISFWSDAQRWQTLS